MDNSNDNQQSFYQFSDQLRVQSSSFSNLSIWGNSFSSKKPEERRNFDIRVGGERERDSQQLQPKGGEFNGFNSGWKIGGGLGVGIGAGVEKNGMNGMNGMNGVNGLNGLNGMNGNGVFHTKYGSNRSGGGSNGKKNKKEEELESKTERRKNHNNNSNKKENDKNSVDKRFKTLPATEALPRNEVVGGYIFVCNNDTMEENLKRQLFGLPPRYRDSVRAITPGLPLFLYNYSTHQLHGIFQAASFGGTNIDPTAWEDKKCPGESRFPAQVKVATRKICNPLEEDAFRPVLHHYDGPKFRLELNIPEALALLDIFDDNSTLEKYT